MVGSALKKKKNTSFISCRKFGSSYLCKATAAARAALPIPKNSDGVFS